jgi:hypothetical protein
MKLIVKKLLYYNPRNDIIGELVIETNGFDNLLVISELDESANMFRVLTDEWILLGTLN